MARYPPGERLILDVFGDSIAYGQRGAADMKPSGNGNPTAVQVSGRYRRRGTISGDAGLRLVLDVLRARFRLFLGGLHGVLGGVRQVVLELGRDVLDALGQLAAVVLELLTRAPLTSVTGITVAASMPTPNAMMPAASGLPWVCRATACGALRTESAALCAAKPALSPSSDALSCTVLTVSAALCLACSELPMTFSLTAVQRRCATRVGLALSASRSTSRVSDARVASMSCLAGRVLEPLRVLLDRVDGAVRHWVDVLEPIATGRVEHSAASLPGAG